ncbi:MAG: hypothetical protein NT169_28480 [Chloroflexi bacterium]|nr:hypothetical protein [Chloroflexota bacterium]
MSMEDLIQAMMGGAGTQGAQSQSADQSAGDPLAAILQALLGGAGQSAISGQTPAQDGMEGLPAGMGGLGDILGAILGGAQGASSQTMPVQSAPDGMGGLGDILGAILSGSAGGDVASSGIGALFAPIISSLAAKLGLPPAMAQMVVSFVMSKLFAARQAGGFLPAQPVQTQPGQRRQAAQPSGLNLDDLFNRMSNGQGVDASYLKSTGLTNELAQQTGMDHATATQSLQEVFNMLSPIPLQRE